MRYRIRLKASAVSVRVERSARPRADERVIEEERATLKRGAYGVLVGVEDSADATPDVPIFRPAPDDPLELIFNAAIDLIVEFVLHLTPNVSGRNRSPQMPRQRTRFVRVGQCTQSSVEILEVDHLILLL